MNCQWGIQRGTDSYLQALIFAFFWLKNKIVNAISASKGKRFPFDRGLSVLIVPHIYGLPQLDALEKERLAAH